MKTQSSWWRARAEDVAATLLFAMFLTFVLQIVSRYVFNQPLGWTLELCLILWLWTVFWGSAFCLGNDEHIRFDMIYNAVNPGLRRVFAGFCALAIAAGMIWALPATWDFVSFLKIKKSASLRIPLFYVFLIYPLFMVATIVLYGHRLRQIFSRRASL
jgi:C4-dicarboxylate transporter DctQ subunit